MPVFPLVTAGSLIHQDTDWDVNIGFLDYYIDRDPDLLLLEPNSVQISADAEGVWEG